MNSLRDAINKIYTFLVAIFLAVLRRLGLR